jgi:hexosaminidase
MLPTMETLIPKPASITPANGSFTIANTTQIYVPEDEPEVQAVGEYLAEILRPATGYDLPVVASGDPTPPGNLSLSLGAFDQELGAEEYLLTIEEQGASLQANQPAGLFYGVQTLRQLLPAVIESSTLQPGPWRLPAGQIRDWPRFTWRGAMLDVARHFFSVQDVESYLDLLSQYKINRLHLHLSDDQGWRIEIRSWPRLAEIGGSTQVGGGPGGYYTQAQYAELVEYARQRYITIVPEIDLPGHTNAALASYAELNCDGSAPPLYTGIEVGFSSLCVDEEITYQFLSDVIKELAALTPGDYLHIGGDEAAATSPADYIRFIERVQPIVQAAGKQMVGWEEITRANLGQAAIAQYWNSSVAQITPQAGVPLIISPANRTYLDMKYVPATSLGLMWAGTVEVQDAYRWDPASVVAGVTEADILGVEAPLWSETLLTLTDIEYMAFPRLIGIAEIGWSPQQGRSWDEYRLRLGAQAARLEELDVTFYHSPQVPWQ